MLTEGGEPLSGDVNALAEGADQGLWIGTESGLYHLPAGADRLRLVQALAGQELAHLSVVGLLMDRQQRLWIDTAIGLHLLKSWDGRSAAFERVSERLGVGGRAYGANLLQDRRGRIWTQQYVHDPQRGPPVYALTPSDGVDIGTGWFRSYAALQDGRMLFGGSRGLLVVTPDGFDGWTYAPPLVVSDLRIDGHHQAAGQVLRGLRLQPGQRSFSVEFAALDFSDPARSRYAYQLEGFDPGWVQTGADFRVASYGNLPPGAYTLKVRATNRSGSWSPHELALAVEVLPSWWQTWWFRAALLALLALGLWGVVQLRTGFLRRRQLALEAMVRHRTAELETLSQSLQQKTLALEESSLTDPLTGLRNRRFLTQHIEADVALALRHFEANAQRGLASPPEADLIFFLLDIDEFKSVNDQYGHGGGDAVLVQMRERLQPVFREADYLIRWGGEEFLIVARGTSREHAAELAERARAMVADHPFTLADGTALRRSCSVGFACFPLSTTQPRGLSWSEVIDLADAALYMAKKAGRNRWHGVQGGTASLNLAAQQGRPRRSMAQWMASGELLIQCSAEPASPAQ